MAKLIRSTQASYRKRRFLALYGDKKNELRVTDYQNNIQHTVQCDSPMEATVMYCWSDTQWFEWLPENQTAPQTKILPHKEN